MTYRPIADKWFLTRSRLLGGQKYYGAYPGGFLERARALMGVHISDPVLHVCSGVVRWYPYHSRAVGPNDATLDLDPMTNPDYCQDARDSYPLGFKAIIADPPYGPEEAAHYAPGPALYPTPGTILRRSLEALEPGRRVGILHWYPPQPPKGAIYVAEITVTIGFNNRPRTFAVYEKGWNK